MESRSTAASQARTTRAQNTTPPSSTAEGSSQDASARPAGGTTPPETPTRSDSVTSMHVKLAARKPAASEQKRSEDRSTEGGTLEYTTGEGDYEVLKDKKLGAGRFSAVFLAQTVTGVAEERSHGALTPPDSPNSVRTQGLCLNASSAVYAVKIPADRSSVNILRGEARLLSHLSRLAECSKYMVPFHGFDPRNNSLVFTALPASLEDLVVKELEVVDPTTRTTKLSAVLPHLARSLTSGLAWMHAAGLVHADIKPPNILLRTNVPVSMPLSDNVRLLDLPFTPVYADFTSSFLVTDDPKTISSVGGGTYDYMAPEQLSPPFPVPNFKMDVYALAVTLLQTITGCSPFREAGPNRHVKMAMIKEGQVLGWALRNTTSKARLQAVADAMLSRDTLDLRALLELGVRKNPDERLDATSWNRLW